MFQKKSGNLMGIKVKTNIFRIQANNSIMCRYFCIEFIDFILANKSLINYTSFFQLMTLKRMMI